jgi:predicted nuclease of predicted toxin-antitoxin system
MDRAPDTEILERAITDKRTIITADLDYPRLLALSHATGPSLVLFRGAGWAENAVIASMNDLLRGLSTQGNRTEYSGGRSRSYPAQMAANRLDHIGREMT